MIWMHIELKNSLIQRWVDKQGRRAICSCWHSYTLKYSFEFLSWDFTGHTWLWWDGVQLNWSTAMLYDTCQKSFSTGQVVSWSNCCSMKHLCACQFYLNNNDFKNQKAWLISGSHLRILQVVWEHTDTAERCFLWCLPCVQRESFK